MKTSRLLILALLACVAQLQAYTAQSVPNTVTSFLTSPPVVMKLEGPVYANPLSQYASYLSGELLIAQNATITGNGSVITFANGATNSTILPFMIFSPSVVKNPVLRESFTATTNKYVWQQTYNNGNNYINVTNTNINSETVYSADCIVNASTSATKFLMKGRIFYHININTSITPKYVIPSYYDQQYQYTSPAWTNPAQTDITTNTSASVTLLLFGTNNTYWGFVTGYNE